MTEMSSASMEGASTAMLAADSPAEIRTVLVHYHIFKNAGTSVDRGLKAYARERWAALETPTGEGHLSPSELGRLIEQSPEILAVSSHTATIEPPHIPGVEIIPLIFIRHPVDRVMSAYSFERRQNADTLGAQKAKTLSFPEYVEFFINRPGDRRFRNYQVSRLAAACHRSDLIELECALDAARKLPFVGLVEMYDESVEVLDSVVQRRIPGFHMSVTKANTNNRADDLEERLTEIRQALGKNLYARLYGANLLDVVLWERVRCQLHQLRSNQTPYLTGSASG